MKKSSFFYLLLTLLCVFFPAGLGYALPMQMHLDAPYTVNPIGEDSVSAFQTLNPKAGFDCTTYVETVLAQHKEQNSASTFQENIIRLRYVSPHVDFFTRAHFMEYHWIPNAITKQFIAVYPIKNTVNSNFKIHLHEWFLKNPFVQHKSERYEQKVYEQPSLVQASIAYVPVQRITNAFVQNLPEFMVVFFLKNIPKNTWAGQREKQNLVTHMGVLINKKLYHASLKTKKITEVDFVSYVNSVPSYVGVSFYSVFP